MGSIFLIATSTNVEYGELKEVREEGRARGKKKICMELFNIYINSEPKTNMRLQKTISICHRNMNENSKLNSKGFFVFFNLTAYMHSS